jgi:ABC-type multidrug transport system fused ATPase/permease subunit
MTTERSVAPRLWAFLGRHWRLAVLQLVLAVSGTLLMFVFPGVTRWFIDEIIPGKKSELILQAAALALAAFTGREVLFYWRTRVNARFEQRMVFDLRGQLHRKIAHMELGWFDKQSTGDVLARMADDVPATQRIILEGIEQGVTALLQIVITMGFMFVANAPFTLILLAPVPLLAAGGWIYARLLAPRAKEAREAGGELSAMLFDTIAGIRQIKSYTSEEMQQGRFNGVSMKLQRVHERMMAAAAIYGPLMTLLGNMGLILLLAVGSWWTIEGKMTLGELTQFLLLIGFLYEPITRLHGVNQNMVSGMAAARRVFEVLDEPQEESLTEGKSVVDVQGHIEFENITFGFQPKRPVLNGVSLSVPARKTVAIVGATGSGKSTLFQLLTRFYDPQQGRITLDSVDVKTLAKADLRDAIGYVTQEAFLFATTVRENLLVGKPGASEQELWLALEQACADDFVRRMEHGLDSEVGERGSRLSGGERQRLAMARAFLKNAPILLLDEATSAVDNKSEHLIQQALTTLRANRTSLVIAHRLSTVVEADQIYVMRLGSVLAHGTHEELMQTCPYYAELAALAFETKQRPA